MESNTLLLDAKGEIVFMQRGAQVTQDDWARLFNFWSEYTSEASTADLLQIPIADFYSKKFWFRPNWLDHGLALETSERLTSAVEEVRRRELLFEDLSSSGYATPSAHLIQEFKELALKREPTDSQVRNIASLLNAPHGANFSVPGSGKTFTSLAVFEILRRRGILDRAVIVCPKSAFDAWVTEPDLAFSHPPAVEVYEGPIIDPRTQILVVNFEKIESPDRQKHLRQWMGESKSLLIIDEAHRIKRGSGGRRWQACIQIAATAVRVDLLTGTPMPQSYEDLRNLLAVSWRTIPRNKVTDAHLARMQPGGVFVRTTKGELGLPDIKISEERVKPGVAQKEIYDAMSRLYRGTLGLAAEDQATLRNKGRAVMTLLAAATNPALIRKDSKEDLARELRWPPAEINKSSDLMSILQSYMTHEMPPKYEWVARYIGIAAQERRKTLVWSSFVGNLELLAQVLKPFQPAVVYGATEKEERELELHRFRFDPNCHVLLTNPQTLGEGISLHTVAHEAIFLDRTYNAAQYLQALDRIHRLGLASDTLTRIYLLQTEGTVDQRVSVRLEQKIELLSQMLNDSGLKQVSLPQSDEQTDLVDLLGIDQNDLNDLFKHLSSGDADG